MTMPPESFSWRIQGAVYGMAFFNGPLQSMTTMIAALLVGGLISTELPLLIAIVLASRQILTVSMSIYGGALMDRLGARSVVIAFGLIGSVSALLYPALPSAFGIAPGAGPSVDPSWLLVAALIALQMVSGYSEATNWTGTQTLVSQLMKGHPVYAGRMTFSARVGGIGGPFVTGLAWDAFGPWGGFSFLAAWILAAVVAALFLPRASDAGPSPAGESQAGRDPAGAGELQAGDEAAPAGGLVSDYAATLRLLLVPAVALVIMATVMRQAGSGIQSSFYVVWLDSEIGLSGALIGILVGASNVASAMAALTTGALARHFAAHTLLIFTIGLSIIGVAVTPLLGDVYVLLMVAICVRGIGQGLNLPLMITILSGNVPMRLMGRVTAMRISFNRFGGAVVPLIMGAMAEVVGIAASFYIIGAAGIVALCALSYWAARSPALRSEAASAD